MTKKIEFTRKKVVIKKKKQGRATTAKSKAKAASLAKLEREHPVELMLTDWSIKYPEKKPHFYLTEIKGYTQKEATTIMNGTPAPDWYAAKNDLLDGMTSSLAKRQIDWAAEMHDLHFEGSKIGLDSAIDWLRFQQTRPEQERDIKMIKVALESVQIAQKIQRTALGLPTDDGAIHIYQNLIMRQQQHTHVNESDKTPVEKLEERLSFDDIQSLIEHRRLEKAKESDMEDAIDV